MGGVADIPSSHSHVWFPLHQPGVQRALVPPGRAQQDGGCYGRDERSGRERGHGDALRLELDAGIRVGGCTGEVGIVTVSHQVVWHSEH